jgi:nucleoside-diphosphate-sugar epimerase
MTYGSSRSIRELVALMVQHFPDVKVERVERDRLMPHRGTLSVGKAQRMLGYAPQHPIEKGFPKYIQWSRELFRQAAEGAERQQLAAL